MGKQSERTDHKERLHIFQKKAARNRCAIRGFVSSDIGAVRSNNEDNYLLNRTWNRSSENKAAQELKACSLDFGWCYGAVFDGMGGGEKGEWASLTAAEEFERILSSAESDTSGEEIDMLARQAFLNANRRIVEERESRAVYGTTGTLVCTDGRRFRIYHMGDSRAYLFREGNLYLLTEDQTLAAMKVRLGFCQNEDACEEREKHQLTEYIGCDPTMENLRPQESQWMEWEDGDRLLLCSDGLYDMCSQTELCDAMNASDSMRQTANQLVGLAISHGGRDNITCMVLERTDRNG